jgi:uncharacterized protein (DUF433 family)
VAQREQKTHASFRFKTRLYDALQRRSRETGLPLTALAERYVDEGLRRDEHPLIVFREASGGRRAALAATRLDVWQVIETVKHSGRSTADAAGYLSIPEPWVTACVRYYADHAEEIDEWTERMHALAEREEDAWRRAQAVLA